MGYKFKILRWFLFLFLTVPLIAADEVIDVNLFVGEEGVDGRVLLTDDEPSTYSGNSGDYELEILDNVGNILWGQNFELSYVYNQTLADMPFDMLGYKMTYDSRMYKLELYKKGNNIFSKHLNFCNNNGVCDYDSESDYSCPGDCASASSMALSVASSVSSTDGVVTFDKTLSKDPSIYWIESVEHDGNYLWAAEPSYKSGVKVFKINDDTGSVVDYYLQRHYTVGVSNVIGLAYDHIHNDIFNHVFPYGPIYVVDANPPYSEIRSFSAPKSWIHDITFDGTYLWGVDGLSPGSIYKISATTGSLLAQINAPVAEGNPIGVTFDGTYLWIARGGYLFQIDQNRAVADGHSENAILQKYSMPVGGRLGWDSTEKRLWTQDNTHFYRIKLPVTKPKLKILFIPLIWTRSQPDFQTEVRKQLDFFINDVPLKNCRDRVYVTVADVSYDDFTCKDALKKIRDFVDKYTIYKSSDFDVIVGLSEITSCWPNTGESNKDDTMWLTIKYNTTFAHEMGHVYGLEDEYCSNKAGSISCYCNDGGDKPLYCRKKDINYLDPNPPFNCNPNKGGNCCGAGAELRECNPTIIPWSPLGYHVCCRGNYNSKGGISIMSYANVDNKWPGARGYDDRSLAHLNTIPQLNCD